MNVLPHSRKVRQLQLALLLLGLFCLAEAIAAAASHSISVAADASHVLSDVGALTITLVATQLAARGGDPSRTSRGELLAASTNSLLLLLVASGLGWEAIARFNAPNPELQETPMLLVALLGIGVNGFNLFSLQRCRCGDLNFQGAFLHVVCDFVGSVGTILAAIAVAGLHWNWADGAIGLLVCATMILLAVPLAFQSLRQLLSGVPPGPLPPPCPQRQAAEALLYPSLDRCLKERPSRL